MVMVFTDMPMAIFMKVNGKMINNKEMVFSSSQMGLVTKGNSCKGSLTAKESINLNQLSTTISSSIVGPGPLPNLMGLEKLSIITAMSMKDNLQRAKGVEMEVTGLIGFINIPASGNIIVFGERANYLKMKKFSSRGYFKKD